MTRAMKFQIAAWAILSLLATSGAFVYELSSSVAVIPLKLIPNETTTVTAFRVLPDTLRLSLSFSREKGQRRIELGEYTTTKDWQKTSRLNFSNPGEPVKLLIGRGASEVVYEAMPASSYGDAIGRALVPYVDDGNPNSYMWPPSVDSGIQLQAGSDEVRVSVIAVGKGIEGEQVSLVIKPPVTFKSYAPNYKWIWWFCWWPMYALLLAAYGLGLFWKSRPRHTGVLKTA